MQALRQQQLRRQRNRRFALTGFASALVIILIVVLVVVLGGGSNNKNKTANSGTSSSTASTASSSTTSTRPTTTLPPVSVPLIDAPKNVGCPKIGGTNPHYTHFSAAPVMCIDPTKTYTATMVTDVGTIVIKLSTAAADQKTVNNFVFLASYHFYDGTAFHRVVTGFVDQGGDPKGTGAGGPGYSFDGGAPSSTKVYTAGALAMANSGSPSSDGSQFFIIVGKGGQGLTANYSYFGQVTKGMEVVNTINKNGSASQTGTPVKEHKIKRVTISVS